MKRRYFIIVSAGGTKIVSKLKATDTEAHVAMGTHSLGSLLVEVNYYYYELVQVGNN